MKNILYSLLCLIGVATLHANSLEESLVDISNPFAPKVEVAFAKSDSGLECYIKFDNTKYKATGTLVAMRKNAKSYKFEQSPAKIFLDNKELGDAPLKLGIELSWFNENGQLRQREVFCTPAIANMLPKDNSNLYTYDLDAYFEELKNRTQRIYIPFAMSQDGKATVVINDKQGKRVRNLISGVEFTAGEHKVEWDGLDELGNIPAAGDFVARIITHKGLEEDYIMQFYNGDDNMFSNWGPNHSSIQSFTANDKYLFAGAPLTEGGNAMVALTYDGKFVKEYPQAHGTGILSVVMLTDKNKLYAIHGGSTWGSAKNHVITMSVFDIESAKPVNIAGKAFTKLVEVPPLKKGDKILQGAAIFDNKIYISNNANKEILVVNMGNGKIESKIPCENPGILKSYDNKLYMANSSGVFVYANNTFKQVFKLNYTPQGFDIFENTIYLTGNSDSTIAIYNLKGKQTGSIGTKGGLYTGKWQSGRLLNPTGVFVNKDKTLWATENTKTPKRITRFDLKKRTVMYEKFGSPPYGSPSGGMDPDNSNSWIAEGVKWELDPNQKSAKPVALLNCGHFGKLEGLLRYHYYKANKGQQYVTGTYRVTVISKFEDNGNRLQDLILMGTVHSVYRHLSDEGKREIAPFLDKVFPKNANDKNRINNGTFVMWSDLNCDGKFSEDELQFAPEGTALGKGYWGFQLVNDEFLLPYVAQNKKYITSFKPTSYNSKGVPIYDLKKIIENKVLIKDAIPLNVKSIETEAFNLSNDIIVTNTDPFMLCFGKDGSIKWLMKNQWSNVHGSHKASMPAVGEMQGVLFSLGQAKLNDGSEVFALMNNHGRIFFVTSEGIYLDELFGDCRVTSTISSGFIGGEPFGGVFTKDERNNKFMLQAGCSGFRVYEIKNLDSIAEEKYNFTLNPEQLSIAAQINAPKEQSDVMQEITIPFYNKYSISQLKSQKESVAFSAPSGTITVKMAIDAQNLYLYYTVPDSSPWVNNGKAWSTMFKTGDCLDFQIALDAKAKKGRRDAQDGDIRVLIVPDGKKAQVVLYRHKISGDKSNTNPMQFNSPWRSITVDDVKKLQGVTSVFENQNVRYNLGVKIPLSELGTSAEALKGNKLQGDVGVIYGDDLGTINLSRIYLMNKETGLVNDVPGETLLTPSKWGTINFGK